MHACTEVSIVARILAVDYGEKRIGLAVSDELGITASPLMTLARRSDDETVRQIAQLASKLRVTQIVVGLPRRTDAQEGEMERKVKAFAEKLRQACLCPSCFLTSGSRPASPSKFCWKPICRVGNESKFATAWLPLSCCKVFWKHSG